MGMKVISMNEMTLETKKENQLENCKKELEEHTHNYAQRKRQTCFSRLPSVIVKQVLYFVCTVYFSKLYLMVPSILIGSVALQFFFSLLQLPIPIWLSSLPPGHKMRPGAYYIMEDVVAVEGGGRSAFRKALKARYEASPIFRRLLYEMTLYWAIGGLIFVGVSAALTFTTSLNIAFGVTLGWIPVWAVLWSIVARFWIGHRLKQEKASFRMENDITSF
jgi:hypothetical protein